MPADTTWPIRATRDKRLLVLIGAGGGLFLLGLLALRLGYRPVSWVDLGRALGAYDPSDPAQIVIREFRLPRLVAALLAGAGLGVAGALIQGMTRNPLADPGLLGINAGAAAGVIAGSFLLGMGAPGQLVWLALGGGAAGAAAVFALGGGAQARPRSGHGPSWDWEDGKRAAWATHNPAAARARMHP